MTNTAPKQNAATTPKRFLTFRRFSNIYTSPPFGRQEYHQPGSASDAKVLCLMQKSLAAMTFAAKPTSVEVTDSHAADSPQFKGLVKTTARNFAMSQVSADKAYLSSDNLQTVVDHNAMPFIPFKANSVTSKNHSAIWKECFTGTRSIRITSWRPITSVQTSKQPFT